MEDLSCVFKGIAELLIEKNRRYGNAALEPLNIFYKGNASNSIAIRLDDKISRVKNSHELRKNDMADILGYLLLYAISKGYYNTDAKDDIAENLDNICQLIHNEKITFKDNVNIFSKNNSILVDMDRYFTDVKNHNSECDQLTLLELIRCFLKYFKENNITNFKELID